MSPMITVDSYPRIVCALGALKAYVYDGNNRLQVVHIKANLDGTYTIKPGPWHQLHAEGNFELCFVKLSSQQALVQLVDQDGNQSFKMLTTVVDEITIEDVDWPTKPHLSNSGGEPRSG